MNITKKMILALMAFGVFQLGFAQDSTSADPQASAQTEQPQEQKEALPTNAQETYKDIEKTLGFVPEFLKKYPKEGVTGAWIEMKQLEMGKTNIEAKNKQLIQLAVAGQIPCEYCVVFHGELAKANGATEAELAEALALSGSVRSWSTVLNGLSIDKANFKNEVTKIVNGMKSKMAE